ncbi:hypothetical protein [Brevibacillus sp. H7]|uniref:hypothetical protein n=1 Tax=Brevibacillus sp. H7 TaxID=3349138 RepID=UPI003807567D
MNSRKWRNPYAPIPSKKLSEKPADVTLAVTPRNIVPATDLRTSVSRMRTNIKGISSTIRQVEQTMDTLYGAMEMIDTLGKKTSTAGNPTPKRGAAETREAVDESADASNNPLGNLDIGQILNLLQSPLVQNLLNQTGSNGGTKRKKEG